MSPFVILGMAVFFVLSFRHYFAVFRQKAATEIRDVL